jgi:glycosyltransferase involved in cell wall biosynthesis
MRSSGVEVIEIGGRASSVARAAAPLARVRRWNADVIHAQSEIHDPRLLAATGRKPLALMVHDPRPHLGAARRPLRLRLWKQLWERRADYLLVHSRALAAELGPQKPVRVLAHGAEVRDEALPAPSTPAVLLFGRLEYYKGVRVLVRAMQTVWASRPDTLLLVAGAGSELAAVPADPRIRTIPGYVPEDEVDALMAQASLVVLPYLEASQSGVGSRAIGAGVPVVVTDVGGLPELALDLSYVVRPGDEEALAVALLRHLDDPRSVREAVLSRARREFGWDSVAARAAQIYDELAAVRR